jgi:chemotaxis protein MotB
MLPVAATQGGGIIGRMAGKGRGGGGVTIVIRREEVVEAGHHGGAWKVAYADFVTAMMAFFLLMWLLNATTEEQKRGLADFFTPSNELSHATSGAGAPFGGRTPYDQGEMVSDRGAQAVIEGKAQIVQDADDATFDQAPDRRAAGSIDDRTRGEKSGLDLGNADRDASGQGQATQSPSGGTAAQAARSQAQVLGMAQQLANAGIGANVPLAQEAAQQEAMRAEALREEMARQEKASFDRAAEQIRDAIRSDPKLMELSSQIAIDQTPEGLRIQILDEDRTPMFASGASALNERARAVLLKIAPVLARLPEPVALSGHTDSAPYKGGDRTNWELSTERANAARRVLVDAGLPEMRFRSVTGNADRDPLLPADPQASANRRIAITVLRAVKSGR